ncbi:MAG: flavodoxin family protein [Clostridia bacterium]|nr:flavodoxin family protein [Clostridia bacterium]
MKVQVIYSSLSGCTRRLAEGIYAAIEAEEKQIWDLKDGEPELDGDVILLGYWVDRGGPGEAMSRFMAKVTGKHVGVFCTLAFWADSAHAHSALHNGVQLLEPNNTVIGGYVCNGSLSQSMIQAFRQRGSGPHSASPANEARWEVMKDHPTSSEIALAAERFGERLRLLEKLTAVGEAFPSISI